MTGIEQAPFGRTGHTSSRVIFGAAGLGSMRPDRAEQLLALLPEFGINHIDTAASYGDSELRLAPWLASHRSSVFLATKTGERTADGARRQLEASLTRLGVDHVDLIQMHNLVEPEEWDVAHGRGGVLEALVQARDEGLVRFIGVTGHGTRIPGMHLRSLERFEYDSVLFPYNFTMLDDAGYRADAERLIAVCGQRNVAVQTIKAVARRRWPADSTDPHYSWYEPLRDDGAIRRAVDFVLGRAGLFLNSTSDGRILRSVFEAAATHGGVPSEESLRRDVAEQQMSALFDGRELERI